MAKEEIYPKKRVVERDGLSATVRLHSIASKFTYGHSGKGDPLGTLTVRGPDFRIKLGGWSILSGYGNLAGHGMERSIDVMRFYGSFTKKYDRDPSDEVVDIVKEALQPYNPFIQLTDGEKNN